jgi:hypothetical protein
MKLQHHPRLLLPRQHGMTMKQLNATARAYIGRASQLDSAHYPETLYKLLIVNAPTVFQFAWSIVKGYLDERTTRKVGTGGQL